jgi:dTDP-4-amino-4,6-dideoxygalactose transaminase
MQIHFLDLKSAHEELRSELDAAYLKFMESGHYVLGKEVSAFEDEYAAYCGAPYCVGVGSGLDALHLGLRAAGCGPGDEVIVSSNTYIATWLAVSQVGATIVPVDPDENTFNLNPNLVEEAVSPRTTVILATNLYGQPCDYDAIRAVAERHGLIFATDNAQSHGALYKGSKVGGLACFECHSFYPTKNLGALGEAGAVTTLDSEIADRIRVLRNYGSRVRYFNEEIGCNSRLDELQAALLRVKLRKLDDWNARRAVLAQLYLDHLDGGKYILPFVPDWAKPVWHLFVIRNQQRDVLHRYLEKNGVQTIIHYPIPPHLSGAYRSKGWVKRSLPIAERLAAEVLSLPIGPHLNKDSVEYLCSLMNGKKEIGTTD